MLKKDSWERQVVSLAAAHYEFFREIENKADVSLWAQIAEDYQLNGIPREIFKRTARRTSYAKQFIKDLEAIHGVEDGKFQDTKGLKENLSFPRTYDLQGDFYPTGFFVTAHLRKWPTSQETLGFYVRNYDEDPLKYGKWENMKIPGGSNLVILVQSEESLQNGSLSKEAMSKSKLLKNLFDKGNDEIYQEITSLTNRAVIEHEKRHLIDFVMGNQGTQYSELIANLAESDELEMPAESIISKSFKQDNPCETETKKKLSAILKEINPALYSPLSHIISTISMLFGEEDVLPRLRHLQHEKIFNLYEGS